MRITFVTPPLDLSGGQRVIATYADRLSRRGHAVTVVAPPHSAPSVRQIMRSLYQGEGWPRHNHAHHFQNTNVTLHILDSVRSVSAADVPDADVVIATWWETAEWVATLPPSKGTKVYLIQHYEAFGYTPADRVDATWRLPMKKILVSNWLGELARERFGDIAFTVIPNAVDQSGFHAPPRNRQLNPTVGLMYSAVAFKGVDVATAAIRKAIARMPGLCINAFGTHSPPSGILPETTRFEQSPHQDRLREIYASCDVWLFASRSEGFGLPILEAMACRTPVIGTPAGAAPELLAQGGGVLVRMEDSEDMANAIVRVCTLPDAKWRVMSDAAYATATRYTWDDATDRFEAALVSAIQDQRQA